MFCSMLGRRELVGQIEEEGKEHNSEPDPYYEVTNLENFLDWVKETFERE